jgi:hypothetical protein
MVPRQLPQPQVGVHPCNMSGRRPQCSLTIERPAAVRDIHSCTTLTLLWICTNIHFRSLAAAISTSMC